MELIYKCRLCGQTYSEKCTIDIKRDLLSKIYQKSIHECIENKQYGIGELIGAKK